MHVAEAVLAQNPLWIVDVGASGGIDPRWGTFLGLSYRGVLFEPDPREYDRLKSASGAQLLVVNAALGDAVTTVTFHLCRKQQVSSVYPPNVSFLRQFPNAERFDVINCLRLRTDTLDRQLRMHGVTEVDFIKLDTQGSELIILQGAVDSLQTALGLEIEVEFAPLYIGQPLFSDIDSYLRCRGFVLCDLKRGYWKRAEIGPASRQKGQLVFGDALYLRPPEAVLAMSPAKIVRGICVYLAYGYADLAHVLFRQAQDRFTPEVRARVKLLLQKSERRALLPNFRGKGRVRWVLERLHAIFEDNAWHAADSELGNR